jgi:16S rRNA (cytosine967-C5)-methyltransferase
MADIRPKAWELLIRWQQSGQYIDSLLAEALPRCSENEKQALSRLCNGTIIYLRQLETLILPFLKKAKSLPPHLMTLLQMAAFEILHQENSPDYAVVNSTVSLARKRFGKLSGLTNAVLHNLIRWRDDGKWLQWQNDSAIPPGLRYSFPDWLVERWRQQFPHDLELLLKTLNGEPLRMLWLLDNSKREELRQFLKEAGLEPVVNSYDKNFFEVRRLQPVLQSAFFLEGAITIQDVSTTFPAKLFGGFFPDEAISDVCAAPGGKTVALRSQFPQNPLIAADLSGRRLKQLQSTLNRLNMENVTLLEADARQYQFPPSRAFLVDAPCSGFGVIRKRSDLRWRRQPEQMAELISLQGEILDNIAPQLPRGGSLVYSTCTFDKEENDGVIHRFLARHPDFAIHNKFSTAIPEAVRMPNGFVRTLPHIHSAEGSFAVLLKRS